MAYGFNLGQIEGLDSSVQTVTVTIANATESNTYTLNYHLNEDDMDTWYDDDETFMLIFTPVGFLLAAPAFTESDVGDTYNVTLSTSAVEENFKSAVEMVLEESGGGSGLPAVTSSDNGKMMQVENGEWEVTQYPYKANYLFNNDVMSSDENASPPIINVIDLPEDADLTNMSTWKVYVNGESLQWDAEQETFIATDRQSYYRFLYVGMDSEDPTTYKKAILEVGNIVGGKGVAIVDTFHLIIKLSEDTIDENFKNAVEEVIQESGGSSSDIKIVHFTYYDNVAACDATFDKILPNLELNANTIFLYNNSPSFSVTFSIRPAALTVQFASRFLNYIYEFTLASDNTVTYQEFQTNVTTESSPK